MCIKIVDSYSIFPVLICLPDHVIFTKTPCSHYLFNACDLPVKKFYTLFISAFFGLGQYLNSRKRLENPPRFTKLSSLGS